MKKLLSFLAQWWVYPSLWSSEQKKEKEKETLNLEKNNIKNNNKWDGICTSEWRINEVLLHDSHYSLINKICFISFWHKSKKTC